MATAQRLYVVTRSQTEYLVEAPSPQSAASVLAEHMGDNVELASKGDIVRLMKAGVELLTKPTAG